MFRFFIISFYILFIGRDILAKNNKSGFFVYSPDISILKNYKFSSVFSPSEKRLLENTSVNTSVYKVEVSSAKISRFKKHMNKQGVKFEPISNVTFYDTTNPFSNLQWSLNNQGETFERFISDIDVIKTMGKLGEDIQLNNVRESSKTITIAVIDSGVDVNHPDLKKNIINNPNECLDLAKYNKCMFENPDRDYCKNTYANNDNNNNGYPLDCQGWSLSEESISDLVEGSPSVKDLVGHGTHISGIIAAEDNDIGIKGIIKNVKIVPIQVGVSTSNYTSGEIPSDKIAKAVLYAIQNEVDVINLSLGWRLSQDSTLMREMIDLAIERNIIIVAAAGNDGHTSPVYPCSYDEVICVGAHDQSGIISDFSNKGTNIDLLAPGSNILSTWPTNLRSKKFTINDDYEYMSGTSQATPHVTGVVALLLNQGVLPENIKTVLFKGARNNPNKGLVKFGNVDLNSSLSQGFDSSFVIPIQKTPALINWGKYKNDKGFAEFSFLLRLKNYGVSLESTKKIKIRSKDKNIHILNPEFVLDSLKNNEEFDYRVKILAPLDIDSRLIFEIKVNEKTYPFMTKAITLIDNKHPNALNIISHESLSGLSYKTFENYVDNKIDLLGYKTDKDKTSLVLLKQDGDHYSSTSHFYLPIKKPVFLKISKVDLEGDGDIEYVITVIDNKLDSKKETNFFVFDKNLKPKRVSIVPNNSFDNELTVLPGSFKWVLYKGRKVPMWIGVGYKKPTKVSDPWSLPLRSVKTKNLYVLTPTGIETIKFPDNIFPIQALYQSNKSKKEGRLSFITTNTYGYLKSYDIFTFHDILSHLKKFELDPFHNLVGIKLLPMSLGRDNDNAYFYSQSVLGSMKVSSIEIKYQSDGVNIQITNKKIPSYGNNPLIRVLSYDGDNSISQSNYRFNNNENSIFSRVGVELIKHHILRTKFALYLPSKDSFDFGSEFVTVNSEGNLYSAAQKSFLPINDCSEADVFGDSMNDAVIFICPESKMLIPVNL